MTAHWSRVFNRVLTVTEMLPPPWATVADWRGASTQQMLALVHAAAAFHCTPGFSGPALTSGPAAFMGPVKGLSSLDRSFQVLKTVVFCTGSGGKLPEVCIVGDGLECLSPPFQQPRFAAHHRRAVRHTALGCTRQALRKASHVCQPRRLSSRKPSVSPNF